MYEYWLSPVDESGTFPIYRLELRVGPHGFGLTNITFARDGQHDNETLAIQAARRLGFNDMPIICIPF